MLRFDYTYTGYIQRWVDGDTVDMNVVRDIDFGFGITQRIIHSGRFRLVTVDTPERGQPGYDEAREFCETWMPVGLEVVVRTHKDPDNWGRYLADLTFKPPVAENASGSMSELLLRHGLAEPYVRGK